VYAGSIEEEKAKREEKDSAEAQRTRRRAEKWATQNRDREEVYIFEGDSGAGRSLAMNRISRPKKIKQTVFFNFLRVGWQNQTQSVGEKARKRVTSGTTGWWRRVFDCKGGA
jgi:hypothetical protein